MFVINSQDEYINTVRIQRDILERLMQQNKQHNQHRDSGGINVGYCKYSAVTLAAPHYAETDGRGTQTDGQCLIQTGT